jgi:hypothetical protein
MFWSRSALLGVLFRRPLALYVLDDRPSDLRSEASIVCSSYGVKFVTDTAVDERMDLCSLSGCVFLHHGCMVAHRRGAQSKSDRGVGDLLLEAAG